MLISQSYEDDEGIRRAQAQILDFALRALGARRAADRQR
jgi:hypothetical protein